MDRTVVIHSPGDGEQAELEEHDLHLINGSTSFGRFFKLIVYRLLLRSVGRAGTRWWVHS